MHCRVVAYMIVHPCANIKVGSGNEKYMETKRRLREEAGQAKEDQP